jgi:hydrogenase maturation protease
MVHVLVIGCGNVQCGDDALGPMAIERLRVLLPNAEFVSCQQLAPELAEQLADCDFAVFIDAACEGEPGKVRIERLSPEAGEMASLTHNVNPAVPLALARELYGHAPHAMLVTGAGASFASGEGISKKGTEALNEICRLVPLLVRDFPVIC